MRTRINRAIKIAESDNYFGYRLSRIEELKRNHEDNKELLQEIFNRPVKVKVTSNCIVLVNGIEIKVPTEIAQKAEYKIERHVLSSNQKFDSLPDAVNYRHKNGGTLYQKVFTTE